MGKTLTFFYSVLDQVRTNLAQPDRTPAQPEPNRTAGPIFLTRAPPCRLPSARARSTRCTTLSTTTTQCRNKWSSSAEYSGQQLKTTFFVYNVVVFAFNLKCVTLVCAGGWLILTAPSVCWRHSMSTQKRNKLHLFSSFFALNDIVYVGGWRVFSWLSLVENNKRKRGQDAG